MFWSPSWSLTESSLVEGPEAIAPRPDHPQFQPSRRRRPPPIAASDHIEQDEVFLFPSTPSPSSSVTSVSPFSNSSLRDISPVSPSPSPKSLCEELKPKHFARSSRLRRRKSTHVRVKDFIPPDVSGLSKQEARVIKNRAAAFLSRQRRREEYEQLEQRVAELQEENARLRDALSDLAMRSSSKNDRSASGGINFQPPRAPAIPMSIALHEMMDVAGCLTPSPDAVYAPISSDAPTIFSPEDNFLNTHNDVNGLSFDQVFSDEGFASSLSVMF